MRLQRSMLLDLDGALWRLLLGDVPIVGTADQLCACASR